MKLWNYTLTFLLLILSLVVIAIFQLPDKNLHIIACDVGQGDAILVTYKNIQIVTDGGPDNKVLTCLGRHVPFWDRRVELVISTHPDSDHLTGLVEVVNRYKVDQLLINPVNPGTDIYRLLENALGSKEVGVVYPSSGLSMGLGLIQLDVFGPTDEQLNRLTVSDASSKLSKYIGVSDTNLFSVVYKLSFEKFSGLFLGDIPPEVSDSLAVHQSIGSVDYIKVPHHGSINGLTQSLLEKTTPKLGIISVGKDNRWGFPAAEILKLLAEQNVKILRTDEMGDVEIITDGERYWLKK